MMFRIEAHPGRPIQEFRVINFFAPYKTFFTSTMLYEGFLIGLRTTMFEYLQKEGLIKNHFANGALSGMCSQVLMQPLFIKNIRNQKKAEVNPIKLKVFDHIGLVALRGAILGLCHLTVYNSVLDFIEQPINPFGL